MGLKLKWMNHNHIDFQVMDEKGDVEIVSITFEEDAAEFALELANASKRFLELANQNSGRTFLVNPDPDMD